MEQTWGSSRTKNTSVPGWDWRRSTSDRHYTDERIANKYLTWSWQLNEKDRDGLTRQQFARYYLMRMGIGHDLKRIALNPRYPRRLASEAEVLALRPELARTK